jgi:hypothetical protein
MNRIRASKRKRRRPTHGGEGSTATEVDLDAGVDVVDDDELVS